MVNMLGLREEGGVGGEVDESERRSGTLNVEVKAGRSGPRVEWSSPGRRWAFLGVHGQLEPLQMERRR